MLYSGAGKTTLSRFVAWMNGLSVFQIKMHNKYTGADFDDDLRAVLRRSGCRVSNRLISGCRVSIWLLSGCRVSSWLLSGCRVGSRLLSGCKISRTLLSGCSLSSRTLSCSALFSRKVSGGRLLSRWLTGSRVCNRLISDCRVSSSRLLSSCKNNKYATWRYVRQQLGLHVYTRY